jgi:hypothetical protein
MNRASDQSCVYVSDRSSSLNRVKAQQQEIAEDGLSLDTATRDITREGLAFRCMKGAGEEALKLEHECLRPRPQSRSAQT